MNTLEAQTREHIMNILHQCIKNGVLLVDNSMLETLSECWAKVKWRHLYKRILAVGKAAPDFGSAHHEVFSFRYSTFKDKPVSSEGFQQESDILTKWFELHPVDEFEHRNLNHAIEIVKRYNSKYQVEPFNVLIDKDNKVLTEIPFMVSLYKTSYQNKSLQIFFTGKIDLPALWQGNKLIVIDHKTDSMFFGPQRFCDEQKHSNQFRGYAWAFEKTSGKKVDGFCINGIPTKIPPVNPKNGIDNWWNDWFVRELFFLDTEPRWREQWLESTIDLVENFLWHLQKESFPMTGRFVRACAKYGGCPYLDVCNQNTEEAKLEFLRSRIYVDDNWSPLKQETNKQKDTK